MKFFTRNSAYEVNFETKQIRRLSGVKDPQPRQGKDGDWRTYDLINEIKVGSQVLITWDKATTPLLEGSPDNAHPATITSEVMSIEV